MCWNHSCFEAARWLVCFLLATGFAASQQQPPPADTMQRILDRLDELEKQNNALLNEIHALRDTLKAQNQNGAVKGQSERVDVTEQRTEDLAETKVGSSQRFPLSLTGMFLLDTSLVEGTKNPTFQQSYGDYGQGAPGGNASLRQSIIGLEFHGPHVFADGAVHGSVSMDFFAHAGEDNVFRLRRGSVSFDWKRRSITFGQEKPLVSPLEPTSYARVGNPPLAGSGNLWLWRPQVRYEERIPLANGAQFTLQGAVLATAETYGEENIPAGISVQYTRPAAEARVEYSRNWSDQTRFAIGVGAHQSRSHVAGFSAPSRLITADFIFKPTSWLSFSGTVLHGENFANLGGLPTGVTVSDGRVVPIRGNAGWLQVALPVTRRLTLDIYSGRQVNIGRDLTPFAIERSLTFAGNVLYRIAPNVVLGFEGSHENLAYLNRITILSNRFDATVAYLF